MGGNATLKWLGAALLVLGLVIVGAGYAHIEEHTPVDIMDTSHARQVVPGVRNELGAVMRNVMRRDRLQARRDHSMRNALPMFYIGGGMGTLGLIILVIGLTSRRGHHPHS